MKANHLERQLVAMAVVGLAVVFAPTGLLLNTYAAEKPDALQKGHAHDEKAEDHKHGEEKEHGKHGKEEGHDEESSHAHGSGEKDEHGHGGNEEEEGGNRFGPGKAITAANKKDGIQLSEKALKTLGVTYGSTTGTSGTFKVPLKSVVFSQDEVGIYRFKEGWHKLIEVVLVSKTASEAVIKSSELHTGDQIVKDGVPLLRAAELEAWGGSGDGHGH